MTPTVIAALLLTTLGVLVIAVLSLDDAAARERHLLDRASGTRRSRRLDAWYSRTNSALLRTKRGRALNLRLRGAGLSIGVLDLALTVAGISVALVTLLYNFFGQIGSVVLVLLVVAVTSRWIESRRQKRLEAFIGQLPEVARVLSNGASAGLALPSAVALAARELDEPAGTELRSIQAELELGRGLEAALGDLNDRLPSRELGVLVQTLVIQSRSGGTLVSALQNIANTLEARKELRREIKTAVSGAVFSGYVVLVIAILSVVVMNVFSPGALDQLAGSSFGRIVLLAAGLFFGAGILLLRRVTTIEV